MELHILHITILYTCICIKLHSPIIGVILSEVHLGPHSGCCVSVVGLYYA